MQELVSAGREPGLLAYVEGAPAGWCAIAPRGKYPALARSRILRPVDDRPVWSVACLYISKKHRRRGLSVAILEAAANHVRQRGGEIVEGYPVEPRSGKVAPAFAWTGIASAFIRAGFHECARRSPTRPIMRRVIESRRHPAAARRQESVSRKGARAGLPLTFKTECLNLSIIARLVYTTPSLPRDSNMPRAPVVLVCVAMIACCPRAVEGDCGLSALLLAQVEAPADLPESDSESKEFAETAVKEVAGLRVRDPGNDRQIVLRDVPVLRYTNPVSGSMNGNVFVWTSDTRAAIIAAVFQFPDHPLSVECHSLSDQPLEVTRADGVTWRPAGRSVVFRAIAGSGTPGKSRGRRLVQMRDLARQFVAERTDPNGDHVVLRLLPQPIYRYEEGNDDLRDGALFAFVEGTNPDIILLLEDRRREAGREWRFAAARLHHRALQLKLDDRVVWSERQLTNSEKSLPDEPYFIFRR